MLKLKRSRAVATSREQPFGLVAHYACEFRRLKEQSLALLDALQEIKISYCPLARTELTLNPVTFAAPAVQVATVHSTRAYPLLGFRFNRGLALRFPFAVH